MVSTVHAVFCGLQEHIKEILQNLPDTALPQLRNGLLAAHQKLSEYYYRSDESLYYTWAASQYCYSSHFRKVADSSIIQSVTLASCTKVSKKILQMNLSFLPTSRLPRKIYNNSTRSNMPVVLDHLIPAPLRLAVHRPPLLFLVLRRKLTLHPGTRGETALSSMNWRSISNSLMRISRLVNLFSGGEAGAHNSQIYIGLSVIFSQFQVSAYTFLSFKFQSKPH
jgi:hypothetical protein